MTLIKFKPAREVMLDSMIPSHFMNAVNELFNESVGKFERKVHFSPRVDVVEKENRFELQVSLPGMKKHEVSVELNDDMLTISGERKMQKEENDKYHTVESFYGRFQRSFSLPENVDLQNIEAEMNDGILKVTLHKVETKTTKTTVSIK